MLAQASDVDRADSSHECGCGCGGTCTCEGRCCDLQCVIRPNFFCGQTLTDRDLTALVEWARTRFGLVRYRGGYGVVCGLDVSCTGPDVDPCCGTVDHKAPAVYINPGYAVDCCGNDLVVCDPMRVDLSSICAELPDPCADLRELPKQDPAQQPDSDLYDNKIDEGRQADELKRLDEYIKGDPCLPWKDRKSLFAVDLKLRYHEELFQGQRTMFRNKCADAQPCGYSRVFERPCVHFDVVKDLRASLEDREAQDWEKDFRNELKAHISEIRAALDGRDPADVLRWVRQHRPTTLCFIEDYICCLIDDDAKNRSKTWQLRVAGWLLIDWILQRLRCDCWSCRPDLGVRIARVLLRRIKVRGGVRCRVVMIDNGPRYRRWVHKACRPIRSGAIDLGPYLWQPISDVRSQFAARNMKLSAKDVRSEDPSDIFVPSLFAVDPDRELHAVLMEDPLGITRVAAFVGADGKTP